ncbi:MAG: zinc ribbon domain-containing protein [Mediterranea sp.]|jgi:hypothetical protein|nr:zinc ribbon domain-containing protein [Mediterranea sp.]
MALINCPECGKEISDKAVSCPNCGVPMRNDTSGLEVEDDEKLLTFPELPQNLKIGQQITNWSFDASIGGFYDRTENTVSSIPHGKVNVNLHTHGIQIWAGLTFFPIHNSQIISLNAASKGKIVSTKKSVIGRAVAGGLILGPLGAVVGGMSGIGTNKQFVDKHYIIINYWDINTKSAQSLLISGDVNKIYSFIRRHKKEKGINISENREAKENTTPAWAIICVIVIIISVIMIMSTSL